MPKPPFPFRRLVCTGVGVIPLLLAACGGGADGGAAADPGPARTLLRTAAEPPGASCVSGGTAVHAGADLNANGELDDSEVTRTVYACDGATGAPGTPGTPGTPGAPGAPGAPGSTGPVSLIAFTAEPAGANCAGGGTRIDAGPDTDRSGTLEPGEISSTAYLCTPPTARAWGTADAISDLAGSSDGPQVATDGAGNAIALWAQASGGWPSLWTSRFVPGRGWSAAEPIEPVNVLQQPDGHHLAVDTAGNALAVWIRAGDVWANRYTTGAGWGTPQQLESGAGPAASARVAIDADGFGMAIWVQESAGVDTVWSSRYVPGTGWGTPTPIGSGSAQELQPRIGADGSGNFMVAWRRFDGAAATLWNQRYTRATGWGTAAPLHPANTSDTYSLNLAVDPAGNGVATWHQHDGTFSQVWASRYAAGSGWSSPMRLDDGPGDAFGSQVAMDGAGNALAVWAKDGNLVARRQAAGAWGATEPVETITVGASVSARIAMNAAGVAQVTWSQEDGARENIWSNRYVPGAGWGTAVRIEAEPEVAYAPQVALDPAGNAVAAWIQHLRSRQVVHVNTFR